ncbi:M23 family metallopeptidase [Nocardioides cavernaquae]|uniref:M23 family metallopeptidase n=1 Tax=Nocardioides cavernaquae TaxID=2321396 RepID=A0A3A5HH98_9ACTN|nr:M23 family metallopeptidase [Nocardioides cavernaquae]RJS47444.1 M23 family metallopeptidase [Nocardioides cavernaquae]
MRLLAVVGGSGMLGAVSAAMLLPLAMMGTMGTSEVALTPVSSCTIGTSELTVDELDDEQRKNAAIILGVAVQLKVPPKGQAIAIATAMQESGMRNLDYGDRDSLGLFQQRPSTGWGTAAQVTTPEYAAKAFFGGPSSPTGNSGLLDIPHWQDLDLTIAAQSVQRSAFPTAYAKWERLANDVVSKMAGADIDCEPLATGSWTLPVASYTLTSGFGSRVHPITGEVRVHTGIDMAAPTGTPVRAVTDGVVEVAGPSSGYGNLITIRHASGIETYYGHLSRIDVRPGDTVSAGELIGAVGSTGNSTGPHLHLEVRHNGTPTDPEPFLREKGLSP